MRKARKPVSLPFDELNSGVETLGNPAGGMVGKILTNPPLNDALSSRLNRRIVVEQLATIAVTGVGHHSHFSLFHRGCTTPLSIHRQLPNKDAP